MNVGLSNLATLKGFVLPEAMASHATYDGRLAEIGKGVAGAFERVLDRRLTRQAGDVFTISADRSFVVVPRYPVEIVTRIEQRDDLRAGWIDLGAVADVLVGLDEASGSLDFGMVMGPYTSGLRITFTGGYHFEALEPSDDDFPTAQPAGSAPLPEDIKEAWLLQCQKIFERTRSLSTAGIKEPDAAAPILPSVKLDEGIVAMLMPHRRFSL